MSVFHNNALIGASGGAAAAEEAAAGPIKSLRFNKDDSAYLNRTPSSAGNRRTWTLSVWCKKAVNGVTMPLLQANPSTNPYLNVAFVNDQIRWLDGGARGQCLTDAVFRDNSAWYHIVCATDTTLSTATDRVKIYVNGVRQDVTFPVTVTQNLQTEVNNTTEHRIGRWLGTSTLYLHSYLADYYLIDGQALEPTDFGAFDDNGVWQAAEYSGTFGTNGFHLLDFASESTVGHDSSGNENDFTANNFSTSAGAGNDVLFDVPTNGTQSDTGAGGEVSGNYATLNPLKKASISTSNGNLDFAHSGTTGNWQVVFSTIGMTSGKYYCEFTCADADSVIGIAKDSHTIANDKYVGNDPNGWGYNGQNGQKLNNSSGSSYGNSFTSGDIIGIAFDATNGSLYFYKNGTAQNSGTAAFTGLTDGPYFFAFSIRDTGSTHSVNFGQRAFAYSAPSNYVALNTASLPTPTIADGSDYFDVDTFVGTGSSHERSEFSFSPGFVWIKNREVARDHRLFDVVRGATKSLQSSNTAAELTESTSLTSFDSDGFTVGSLTAVNESTKNHVAWAWDAGSSTVSNTDGSITSQVRANQTAGFSIVTYSGVDTPSSNTVGHGLNVAPVLWLIKNRSDTGNWTFTFNFLDGSNDYMFMNLQDAKADQGAPWDTAPTSSVITLGANDLNTCNAGDDYVMYAFAPVAGYSAFGSYEGNGSTDGPFVYTGFRVAFLMWKKSSVSGGNWYIEDTGRSPTNPVNGVLRPNTSETELSSSTGQIVDLLSNGFRVKNISDQHNSSGVTYIYWAVAENPFSSNGGLAR